MIEIWIGFAGGILIGATGSGLGMVVTPLLVLIGRSPAVAIGMGLGTLVATKFVGAVSHCQLGHWPGRGAWFLMSGGAIGVMLTWWTFHVWVPVVSPAESWWKRLLGLGVLATCSALLVMNRKGVNSQLLDGEKRSTVLLAVGAGVAAPVTLTSMGSGSLLVPVLALVTDWSVPKLAAASNLFGCVVGAVSIALYAKFGVFDWELFAKLLAGLLPGVGMGSLLSRVIPRHWFTRVVGVVGIYLGARLLLS